MVINPCCIPLHTAVKFIANLSMGLAIAVGGMSFRIICISSEILEDPVKKLFPDLEEDEIQELVSTSPFYTSLEEKLRTRNVYSNTLFSAGLLTLVTLFIHFFVSLFLLIFHNKESKSWSQIWTAVTCGVIFSLFNSIVLLLCQERNGEDYENEINFFLLLLTAHFILSTYFFFLVLADV